MWYQKLSGSQNRIKISDLADRLEPLVKGIVAMNARLSSELWHGVENLAILPQAAALCYRVELGRPEVLLITTRQTRRWIIPKGWLMPGLTAAETATQEAWEEAGVVGKCGDQSLGQFPFVKMRPRKGPVLCMVDVYPLHVKSLAQEFPEKGQRKRQWCSLKKAASKVASPELAAILRSFKSGLH